METDAVSIASAERRAAVWVVDHFGVVQIRTGDSVEKRFVAAGHLPVEDFVVTEVDLSNQEFASNDLSLLAGLSELTSLDLSATQTSDAALTTIGQAPRLRKLYLRGTTITGPALARLENGPRIQCLSLSSNRQIDDSAIRAIVTAMPNIRFLTLTGTSITDRALRHVVCLTQLRGLGVENTHATPEGTDCVARFLPDCRIKS